ncbi:MAG: GTPase [Bacillota bacterium]|nr:GTPase [Bacillota bacterium]
MSDDFDVIAEMFKKVKSEMENMQPVNIMIIGKTGVGKSTLINNVFRERLAETGIGRPVTQHLRKISKQGIPISLYDTKGLELDSGIQEEIKKEILSEIDRTNSEFGRNSRADNLIHVCWYCINSNSRRIEDFEIQWINEIAGRIPVVLVLTQSFQKKESGEFKKYIENLNLKVNSVVTVLAEAFQIDEDYTVKPFGLEQLVEITYEVLPEGVKRSFNNAQKVSIEKKVKEARLWSISYIAGAGAIGASPIPFADAPFLAATQIGMIAHITTIFGVSLDKALLTSIISSVGGVAGATITGRTLVANLLKFIPGVGTITGGAISGSVATLLTTAIAAAYINVMKYVLEKELQGIEVSSVDIAERMKEEYKNQITLKHK